MRFLSTCVFLCLSLVLVIPLLAQKSATSIQQDTQAVALAQQSLAALTGGQPFTDITLTGTARRIAGSDDESGNGTLKALASGAARLDLSFPSGHRAELFNPSATPPTGSWSGSDGVSHPMAFHNLLTETAWSFPAFAISRRLSTSAFVATYIGLESLSGQSVYHISVSQTGAYPDPTGGPAYSHLTKVDLFLDSTSLLPAVLFFNTHPDSNALLDIPVEIHFSDYRSVSANQIPFHIQKFLNNSLIFDFQAQSATPNSGLSVSTFGAL